MPDRHFFIAQAPTFAGAAATDSARVHLRRLLRRATARAANAIGRRAACSCSGWRCAIPATAVRSSAKSSVTTSLTYFRSQHVGAVPEGLAEAFPQPPNCMSTAVAVATASFTECSFGFFATSSELGVLIQLALHLRAGLRRARGAPHSTLRGRISGEAAIQHLIHVQAHTANRAHSGHPLNKMER